MSDVELILPTERGCVEWDMKGKINELRRNENLRGLYTDKDKKKRDFQAVISFLHH